MARFHTIASQSTICKHIIQIIKKIAKLNIGYCSTKFRIESKNIDYSTCGKSLERNFVCTFTNKLFKKTTIQVKSKDRNHPSPRI